MKTQNELIEFYEKRLEKVKSQWPLDSKHVDAERSKEYIRCAEENLEAVKNGRNF
jgi:hypothetical protein